MRKQNNNHKRRSHDHRQRRKKKRNNLKRKSKTKRKPSQSQGSLNYMTRPDIPVNEVRYNAPPIFKGGATDSDDTDKEDMSPPPNHKPYQAQIKNITVHSNSVDPAAPNVNKAYRSRHSKHKHRSFTPRDVNKYSYNVYNIDDNVDNNYPDIKDWTAHQVANYVVSIYPELNVYVGIIERSKINGIDFVCMQKTEDFKATFNIQYGAHIQLFLFITNKLLMEYKGKDKRILIMKDKQQNIKNNNNNNNDNNNNTDNENDNINLTNDDLKLMTDNGELRDLKLVMAMSNSPSAGLISQ